MPPHAVHEPIAAPRSSGGKVATITARALGVSSAPKTPCRARPATSTSIDGASAQITLTTPKPDDAQREDPPLAVDVAERAADEDERAEREQVGVGDPLLAGQAAAEVALDGRQRDVDRGRVEPRHERPQDRGQQREALATLGHETMLRTREPASAEAVAGGPLPDRRQQETRSRTAWGALRRVRPRGGRSRLQSGGPRNPWASLSAVRFRVEGQLMKGPRGGQGPFRRDPANTGDFHPAVARPRTLGRAADRGRRGERARHRRGPSAS